jgi:hypothetical protein
MNWDAIGAIGEIVGAAAVVATLFYLARQIRDSTQQARIASVTDLNSLYNESFLPIYNNRENMEIWVQGLAAPDALTESDREIFFLFMRRLLNPFDTAVTQYLGGTLETHQFERYRIFTLELVETPGGAAFLAATPSQLTEDARRLLGLAAERSS